MDYEHEPDPLFAGPRPTFQSALDAASEAQTSLQASLLKGQQAHDVLEESHLADHLLEEDLAEAERRAEESNEAEAEETATEWLIRATGGLLSLSRKSRNTVPDALLAQARGRDRSKEGVSTWHSRISMGESGAAAYSVVGGFPETDSPAWWVLVYRTISVCFLCSNAPLEGLPSKVSFCDPEKMVSGSDSSLALLMESLLAFQESALHLEDCHELRPDANSARTSYSIGLVIWGRDKPVGAALKDAVTETYDRWPLGHYTDDFRYNACDDSILAAFDLSRQGHYSGALKGRQAEAGRYHSLFLVRSIRSGGN